MKWTMKLAKAIPNDPPQATENHEIRNYFLLKSLYFFYERFSIISSSNTGFRNYSILRINLRKSG